MAQRQRSDEARRSDRENEHAHDGHGHDDTPPHIEPHTEQADGNVDVDNAVGSEKERTKTDKKLDVENDKEQDTEAQVELQADDNDVDALLTDPFLPVPIPIESALRMTAASFVAYCLVFAVNPTILPPTQQWLIGLLAPIIAMRIPNMVLAVGGFPCLAYMIVTFGLASASLMLWSLDVGGDGAMVVVATLWALWVSGLRFGPGSELIGIVTSFLVVLVSLFALGLHRLIRDGATMSVSSQVLAALSNNDVDASFVKQDQVPLNKDGSVSDIFLGLLGLVQGMIFTIRSSSNGITMVLPEDTGMFAGKVAHMELLQDDGSLVISIEGGIWWLHGFWTWSGTQNPLAVMHNFYITGSWVIVAIFCSHLLPPWRTMRYQLTRIQLPQSLRDTSALLEAPNHPVRNRLIERCHAMHGGLEAIMTSFEPRLADWRGHWPRCTFVPLFRMTNCVENHMVKALLLDSLHVDRQEGVPVGVIQTFRSNAQLLTDMLPPKIPTGAVAKNILETYDDHELTYHAQNDDPLWLQASTDELDSLSTAFMEAMRLHPNTTLDSKERVSNLLLVALPYLMPALAFLARLFIEIPLTTVRALTGGVEGFDVQKAAHHLKFAIGFCAFFAMTVYWDAYHDFEIGLSNDESKPFDIVSGSIFGSFSGWLLIAYSFSTMPTAEGTAKKCVLRVIGTLIGGFSAWAAIRTTGENKYGFVAWLTITTFGGAYLSVDKGENAERSRMKGSSPDYGYAGFYIVLTQCVICMEFVAGFGEGDELVVNRIVSNLTGIAGATLLAVLPPTVRGGDPKWTLRLVTETNKTLHESVQCILESNVEGLKELKQHYERRANAVRSEAKYLLEDAMRLNSLPFFQVNPNLSELLREAGITSSFLSLVLDRAIKTMPKSNAALTDEQKERLQRLLNPEENRCIADGEVPWELPIFSIMSILLYINARLIHHTQALSSPDFEAPISIEMVAPRGSKSGVQPTNVSDSEIIDDI